MTTENLLVAEWTDAELEVLVSVMRDGTQSCDCLHKFPGRTYHALTERRRKLRNSGVPDNGFFPQAPWTEAEIAKLTGGMAAGERTVVMCHEGWFPDRSPRSVESKRKFLRRAGYVDRGPKTVPIDEARRQKIRELYTAGTAIKAIAREAKVSASAVTRILELEGLRQPTKRDDAMWRARKEIVPEYEPQVLKQKRVVQAMNECNLHLADLCRAYGGRGRTFAQAFREAVARYEERCELELPEERIPPTRLSIWTVTFPSNASLAADCA